ncbi:MAG: hypothetical protein IAB81_03265 [Bacteroidetes bacterium]|uniref:Uncharacterized protein n=1 Tax=Candidatus Merdivivens pullicola TaxID=2840872 RepID=A0A9D9IJB6_9BACT|nr:hypothetical protein [Candidatus Merdivivens pullicola]
MKKTLLTLIVLTMAFATTSFAQDAKRAAVLDKQEEFFNTIKDGLETKDTKIKPKDFRSNQRCYKLWQQFFIEYSKSKSFLGSDDTDTIDLKLFSTIYSTMTKSANKNITTNDVYVHNIGISYTEEDTTKNGKIKGYIYTTENEVGVASVKDDTLHSRARYHVEIEWIVTWKCSGQGKDTTYKPTIANISTYEIPYLTKEKQQMGQTAKELIENWYATETVNETFAKYNPVSVKTLDGNISVETPQGQKFIVTNVPEIRIDMNPEEFMTGDKTLYLEPIEAYRILKPVFEITINDDFTSGSITNVDFKEITLHKPETVAERIEKYIKQEQLINDYVAGLTNYVNDRSDSLRTALEGMFADKTSSVIEVSNVVADKETIRTRTAEQYLKRLKGNLMQIELGEPVIGTGLETIVYPVYQQYESATYSDNTEKEIHLLYDAESAKYLIDKILVIKGSTKLLSK